MKRFLRRLRIWLYDLCPICEKRLVQVGELVSPVFILDCYCDEWHYLRQTSATIGGGITCERFGEDAEDYLSAITGVEDDEETPPAIH